MNEVINNMVIEMGKASKELQSKFPNMRFVIQALTVDQIPVYLDSMKQAGVSDEVVETMRLAFNSEPGSNN